MLKVLRTNPNGNQETVTYKDDADYRAHMRYMELRYRTEHRNAVPFIGQILSYKSTMYLHGIPTVEMRVVTSITRCPLGGRPSAATGITRYEKS